MFPINLLVENELVQRISGKQHEFHFMFLCSLVLFIEIYFFFPEIFEMQFLLGILFPPNLVVAMKYHLNGSLDHEILWNDWSIAFTFLIPTGNTKMFLFPLKWKS